MKKSIMIVLIIILLMNGCGKQEGAISNIEAAKIEKIASVIDLNQDAIVLEEVENIRGILYFDSKQVVYSVEGEYNLELETTDDFIYHYNIKSGKSTLITQINNYRMSFMECVNLDDFLYYCYSTYNGKEQIEQILIISLKDFTAKVVPSNYADSVGTRLTAVDHYIYRYYQRNPSADHTYFYIDKMNFEGDDEKIIQAEYRDSRGEILVSVCIDEDSIFGFSTKLDAGTEYVISEFDLSGNLLRDYTVDLEEFLQLNEIDDQDAVFEIFKAGDYLTLKTINRRVKIYRIVQDELIEIHMLDVFEETQGIYTIKNYGQTNEFMYFKGLNSESKFYVFNTDQCKILEYNLESHGLDIDHTMRDAEGNIIIRTRDENEIYQYFFIEKESFIPE